MTKTKVMISKGYDQLNFEFDDYDEAANFIWTALYNAESQITATVEVVKDGEKQDESNSDD